MFDEFFDAVGDTWDSVKDFFGVKDVKEAVSTAKDIKDIVTDREKAQKQQGFVKMSLTRTPSSSATMGFTAPSGLQALGFTSSPDMRAATSAVLNSSNENIRTAFNDARRRRGIGPTITLDSREFSSYVPEPNAPRIPATRQA